MKKLLIALMALGLMGASLEARRCYKGCYRSACEPCEQVCEPACPKPCRQACPAEPECRKVCETICTSERKPKVSYTVSGKPCCVKTYQFERLVPADEIIHKSYVCPTDTPCRIEDGDYQCQYQAVEVTEQMGGKLSSQHGDY